MSKKVITIIILIMFFVAIGITAIILVMQNRDPSTAEEAILRAQKYSPDGGCETVETTAIHRNTGAIYTFPSGCIPDGWMVPTPYNQP